MSKWYETDDRRKWNKWSYAAEQKTLGPIGYAASLFFGLLAFLLTSGLLG